MVLLRVTSEVVDSKDRGLGRVAVGEGVVTRNYCTGLSIDELLTCALLLPTLVNRLLPPWIQLI